MDRIVKYFRKHTNDNNGANSIDKVVEGLASLMVIFCMQQIEWYI